MYRFVKFLVLAVLALGVAACGSGTASESPTPVTQTVDTGTPISVAGGEIKIVSATYSPEGFAPFTDGVQSWLGVYGEVVSGSPDMNQLGESVTLTAADGTTCQLVASAAENTPFWVFIVPLKSQSFVLHLPGFEVPLDSLLAQ